MADIAKLLEEIDSLTVIELSELVKGIEEKYKDKLDAKLLTKVKNLKSKVASYGKEKGYISEEDAKKFMELIYRLFKDIL